MTHLSCPQVSQNFGYYGLNHLLKQSYPLNQNKFTLLIFVPSALFFINSVFLQSVIHTDKGENQFSRVL